MGRWLRFSPRALPRDPRVAGKVGESADAAFAEHHVVVAFAEDVFGGHEKFVESGGHAALRERAFWRGQRV